MTREALNIEPLAIMFPKDDPAFKKLVDGEVSRMIVDGEIHRIYRRWFRVADTAKGNQPAAGDELSAPRLVQGADGLAAKLNRNRGPYDPSSRRSATCWRWPSQSSSASSPAVAAWSAISLTRVDRAAERIASVSLARRRESRPCRCLSADADPRSGTTSSLPMPR